MKQEDIDKLLKCRKIVDYFLVYYSHIEESYDQCVVYIEDELKKEGISSFAEFIEFNRKSNLDTYKECNPIEGECSGCPHLEIAPCYLLTRKLYKSDNCMGRNTNLNDAAYQMQWALDVDGTTEQIKITKNNRSYIVCPEGYGFYIDETKRKSPSFDIYWEISKGKPANANWTKQDFEKSAIIKPTLKVVSNG